MIWKLVARVRVHDGHVTNLTSTRPVREKFKFFTIALGPRRQLRCVCGRTWTMKPTEYDLTANDDTCMHIRALYGNGTVQHQLQPIRALGPFGAMSIPQDPQHVRVGKVYLTPLGEQHFHHRWAANALSK